MVIRLGRALPRASSDLPGSLACRAGAHRDCSRFLPYLVLLRVGFALPASSRTPRCALPAPFHPYRILADAAVRFLWHWPSTALDGGLPDVIRHTALRSSDFPPRQAGATIRSNYLHIHYRCLGDRSVARRTVLVWHFSNVELLRLRNEKPGTRNLLPLGWSGSGRRATCRV
jgi:hypothetical protein